MRDETSPQRRMTQDAMRSSEAPRQVALLVRPHRHTCGLRRSAGCDSQQSPICDLWCAPLRGRHDSPLAYRREHFPQSHRLLEPVSFVHVLRQPHPLGMRRHVLHTWESAIAYRYRDRQPQCLNPGRRPSPPSLTVPVRHFKRKAHHSLPLRLPRLLARVVVVPKLQRHCGNHTDVRRLTQSGLRGWFRGCASSVPCSENAN